ncbi:alpha/beta fold hydrolase [Leifsonia sp. C5G2]|nr:alpha/beta hydrolase [Leifsonia sp. C5G2]NUU08148.1 alpha/beta fold hydrolase [Leifsonia sp. C5G2]
MERPVTAPAPVAAPVAGGTLAGGVWHPDAGGMPLLAIHGITANHLAWQLVADALPDTRVIAPDLRGRGRSGDLPGPFTLNDHADDLARLLDALSVERATVAGHSMGAFVAVRLAERHPGRTDRLVLIDGGLPLVRPAGIPHEQVAEAVLGPALARLRRTFASPAEYEEFWRQHPAIGPWWNDAFAAYVAYDLVGEAPRLRSSASEGAVAVNSLELYGDDGYTEALEGLRLPIEFFRAPRGLLDGPPLYAPEVVAEWRRRLPLARFHETNDVNHYTILMTERGVEQILPALEGPASRTPASDPKETPA